LDHGTQDTQGHGRQDAPYKLGGLVEMDDSYFGGSKAGKRGRGAAGKAAVVVSVEDRGRKAGFAKMHKVENVRSDRIRPIADNGFAEGTVAKTDGLRAYAAAFRDSHISMKLS